MGKPGCLQPPDKGEDILRKNMTDLAGLAARRQYLAGRYTKLDVSLCTRLKQPEKPMKRKAACWFSPGNHAAFFAAPEICILYMQKKERTKEGVKNDE